MRHQDARHGNDDTEQRHAGYAHFDTLSDTALTNMSSAIVHDGPVVGELLHNIIISIGKSIFPDKKASYVVKKPETNSQADRPVAANAACAIRAAFHRNPDAGR